MDTYKKGENLNDLVSIQYRKNTNNYDLSRLRMHLKLLCTFLFIFPIYFEAPMLQEYISKVNCRSYLDARPKICN